MICFLLCIFGTRGFAQDKLFPKGSYSLDLSTRYAAAFGAHDANVGAVSVGANYFIMANLSLGAELSGYGFSQTGDDALGVGLSGVFRHHFFQTGSSTIFTDVLFGPAETTDPTPDGGTRFNFITRVGLGFTHPLNDRCRLLAGARYWHLSNARIEGNDDANPSFNGVEFFVGVQW